MPAKVIPFHDKRNLYKPKPPVRSITKIRLGRRKGLSYGLCIDLSVIPGFDSRPPEVISMPGEKSGVENGSKTLKTKRKRR